MGLVVCCCWPERADQRSPAVLVTVHEVTWATFQVTVAVSPFCTSEARTFQEMTLGTGVLLTHAPPAQTSGAMHWAMTLPVQSTTVLPEQERAQDALQEAGTFTVALSLVEPFWFVQVRP